MSSTFALRIAATDPKRSNSAALRAEPNCGMSSNTDSSITLDLRERWKEIAKRWASSRILCSR